MLPGETVLGATGETVLGELGYWPVYQEMC